jgi:hypothetical protein
VSINLRYCAARQRKQFDEAEYWVLTEEETEWAAVKSIVLPCALSSLPWPASKTTPLSRMFASWFVRR